MVGRLRKVSLPEDTFNKLLSCLVSPIFSLIAQHALGLCFDTDNGGGNEVLALLVLTKNITGTIIVMCFDNTVFMHSSVSELI